MLAADWEPLAGASLTGRPAPVRHLGVQLASVQGLGRRPASLRVGASVGVLRAPLRFCGGFGQSGRGGRMKCRAGTVPVPVRLVGLCGGVPRWDPPIARNAYPLKEQEHARLCAA